MSSFPDACKLAGLRLPLAAKAAGSVVTWTRRGALDLSRFPDLPLIVKLLSFVADSEVLNRAFLAVLRDGLKDRWKDLQPEQLLEVLVSLRTLCDADRAIAAGRPGTSASRVLLHIARDANASVAALLTPPAAQEAQPATAAGAGGGGGGGNGVGRLPAGAPLLLARAYVSFNLSVSMLRNSAPIGDKNGDQLSLVTQMRNEQTRTLKLCLGRVDLSDPRATPVGELARLVAGMVGVVTTPDDKEMAKHMQEFVYAILERSGELSQPERALLAELPPHFALPLGWREKLRSGDDAQAQAAVAFLAQRKEGK